MMNDLEICKAIAEIEFGEKSDDWWYSEGIVSYLTSDLVGFFKQAKEYNPLTDNALCFQLMIKYKLSLFAPEGEQTNWDCIIIDIFTCDENPNKAICLAIIEANKGK